MQRRVEMDGRALATLEASPATLLEAVETLLRQLLLERKQLSPVREPVQSPKLAGPSPVKKLIPLVTKETDKDSLAGLALHESTSSSLFQLRRSRDTLKSPRSSRKSRELRKNEITLSPISLQSAGGRGHRRSEAPTPAPSSVPGAWHEETESEEEMQEALLRKRIEATERRLEKNARLQEWLNSKEERERSVQLQREAELRRIREDATERELRRLERAREQKQKLVEYHQRVKDEAEQIKKMLSLGIDPSSLAIARK